MFGFLFELCGLNNSDKYQKPVLDEGILTITLNVWFLETWKLSFTYAHCCSLSILFAAMWTTLADNSVVKYFEAVWTRFADNSMEEFTWLS